VTTETGTGDEPNAFSITASPSGAASRQIAVMSSAPRSSRKVRAATTYAERLPDDLSGRQCYVLDPMLATGGTLAAAIRFLTDRGADDITAICLLAAPEGVDNLEKALDGLEVPVTVVTAALDEKLNDKGYIVPGLGDAGDRLYGVAH